MSRRLLPIAVAALLSSAARPCIGQVDAARVARLARVADSLGAVRVHEGVTGLVIGVYHGERPLYVHAFGLADEASGRAMATGQAMDVASITKQFTAAGVLRLVDQGKVALDAPLSRYVTDVGPTLGVVTVRQLLNQTSGVGHYEPAFQTHAPQSRDDILRVLRDAPADAAAGTRFTYNNANYVLLGRVIERVTGKPWDDYLAVSFFTPLGMRDTRACPAERGTLPTGYLVSAGGAHAARPPLSIAMTEAAGGLCSTAGDLARWAAALHGGRVLTLASYTLMTTPSGVGGEQRYAMGTVVDSLGGHRRLWHNGGLTSGFSAQLAHYPADSLTVVVLANAYPAKPEVLEAELFRAWGGLTPAPPAPVAPVDHAQAGLAMVDPNGRTLPLRP